MVGDEVLFVDPNNDIGGWGDMDIRHRYTQLYPSSGGNTRHYNVRGGTRQVRDSARYDGGDSRIKRWNPSTRYRLNDGVGEGLPP